MVEIHSYQGSSGQRTYIHYGRRGRVIDGDFSDGKASIRTHQAANPYLYGT